jgi:hypothetical protein
VVSILSLWLPILIAAILVFVASSIIHMFLKYHQTDFSALPDEGGIMDALRPFNLPPGEYVMPHAVGNAERGSDAYKDKAGKGPVAFLNVFPNGVPDMNRSLVEWFVYCIIVGIFAAYIAGRAVGPGGDYLEVFRFAGCTAFIGYSVALMQNSIWYKRSWKSTLKSMFDGLIYGMLTAGAFGWLWP